MSASATTAAPTFDDRTAICEICRCSWERACPDGCAWDPAYRKHGHAVCTACTEPPFSAEPITTVIGGDFVPDPSGRWQLFVQSRSRHGHISVKAILSGPEPYIQALLSAMNAAHATAMLALVRAGTPLG